MKIKKLTALAITIFLIGMSIILYLFNNTENIRIDTVAVNDITQSLVKQWNDLDKLDLPCLEYGLDYVVLDNKGNFIGSTREGLNENINSAVNNRDTIVDILLDTKVLGKLIIYNNTNELWKQHRDNLLITSLLIVTFTTLFCLAYGMYIDRTIFRPFRKLQAFARHVAAGELDMPLEMDEGNIFGAFTESFDLMREELAKARENERKASQSKKELVASLSHDIKTPVASIKAVSEIMIVKSNSEEDKKQLGIINSKADQINILINNIFNATLEELQELKVIVGEIWSTELYDLIKNADYNNRAIVSIIPECIVSVDSLRLLQVIENIISNSYKYADTSINIIGNIKGQYLELEFKDYGLGISSEEAPLLFNKFYRGKNSIRKSGTGLGLYISKYLMNKMQGDIEYKATDIGFALILKLRIS
ncbi:HAMP domain-containing histidine kinase [Tissierella carlieri]|uniref:histidine kinase n=1 Tax=Tissierella carlieri TaxID=689904 RepID=A0ABT1S7Y5_9FIRM|nr:HAMP domain-containing sensor histidine kinase [Tissierella carlieri]MBU5311958.1 HAMP domain-containing histidine kinase [Tissierella carlieri]MCQ4922585.1 HAMP domain-containing histidine kinase [Tissierella carlieri]